MHGPAPSPASGAPGPFHLHPVRAFLGLGSNLGDRRAILRRAVAGLSGPPGVTVTGVSPLYETDPVGGPEGQGPFLNLVVEVAVDPASPPEPPRDAGGRERLVAAARLLLDLCHRLEEEARRVRTVRWGPRTLDVDVLLVEDLTLEEEDLQVPHPRMFERRFVLVPLADLAPELVPEESADPPGGIVTPAGML